MYLSVSAGWSRRCVGPRIDASQVVAEIFDDLNSCREPGFRVQTAALTFTAERPAGPVIDTDNHLLVSFNAETGFGALIWYVTEGWPRTGGIYDDTWVTTNLRPVDSDPLVVADSHTGEYHHRSSAIPDASVRAALTEYCTTATGDRPECVSWVPSRIDGWPLDAPPREQRPLTPNDQDPFDDPFSAYQP